MGADHGDDFPIMALLLKEFSRSEPVGEAFLNGVLQAFRVGRVEGSGHTGSPDAHGPTYIEDSKSSMETFQSASGESSFSSLFICLVRSQ